MKTQTCCTKQQFGVDPDLRETHAGNSKATDSSTLPYEITDQEIDRMKTEKLQENKK